MKRMLPLPGLVGLLLVFLAAASPLCAADTAFVSRYGGNDVTLNRGGKPIAVRVQMLISAGETITAGDGSFVEVRYLSDGCTLRAENGRSIVVGSASPCAKPARAVTPPAQDTSTKSAERAALAVPANDAVARVSSKSGPLTRVNLGNGLVELKTGTELKLGNTVFAGQGSTVTIYFYTSRCEFTVQPENYIEIAKGAPCESEVKADVRTPSTTANADLGLAVGAAAVLGGGGALAVLLLTGEEDKDEDTPATPQ